jgi:NADH-quinone oxidoreductase subunit A
VVYRELRLFAFAEMALFLALILCGYFYIWKKGALDWPAREAHAPARPEPARQDAA